MFKPKRASFLQISIDYRGDGIIYKTESNSLFITATLAAGCRVYTDSIDKWQNGQLISGDEKKEIFKNVVQTLARGKEKVIVVVNVDHDKLL